MQQQKKSHYQNLRSEILYMNYFHIRPLIIKQMLDLQSIVLFQTTGESFSSHEVTKIQCGTTQMSQEQ